MMRKEYKVLVVDDEQDVVEIFSVLKKELGYDGFNVSFDFLNSLDSESFEVSKPYDVVMFDCNFPASNLVKFGEKKDKMGFSLIKKFREKNYRTKVIFYSSSFNIEQGESPFNTKEFFTIINELNVFRMVERNNTKVLMDSIVQAINDLDMVMISMEDIYREYIDDKVTFNTGKKEITLKELIDQLKTGGNDAEEFRQETIKNILYFMLNFKI
ncbi:response regulator [Clostridium estertheticum]|uniref:response regulator n=1 Tax=Clostridium estertheticum TaxID=238834 RepID=UPI001C6E7D60|nr:response regulator [Clostridium estertheticum]MBW9150991.1 response regulator [Clostridium estertheticum]WLC84298.1 response regulator [Clostridium estertheticum]